MTVNRTTLLDLPLPVTGTESGTWGDVTNNGLTQYLDIAIAGALSVTSSVTLDTTEGDSAGTNIAGTTAQYRTLLVPASGPSANIVITAPASNRTYHVVNRNATYTVQVRAGAGTGVTIGVNQSATVAYNGTDYALVGPIGPVVPVANGGTGQTSYTNGQLLIGNTTGNTLTKATLTAGTGISITNGAGSISVAATNNGTVTSVGGTGTVQGLTLSGTVTSSGSLTLGGSLSAVSLTTQVSGTLPVANGGTGQTSYTNGQLLIGNTTGNTLTKATLTAGTGISITNGAGSISVAATNNGTVTSVATGTGLTGGPITSTGTVSVATNGITNTLLRDSAALSVIGRSANSTGDPADIAAATDHQVLRRSGTALAFGSIALNQSAAVTGTLPVANGGTGQTSYTNGQLLIGNTTGNTLTKATLTAGTGISITNGAGSISIASTVSGGGDYKMVTFTSPGTWTKPAGLKAVKVTVVGGGGAGGPAGQGAGGGGGGGGGAAIRFLPAPSIPGPVSVTRGAAASTSSFGAFASATGGSAGAAAPSSPTSAFGGNGGLGGLGSSGDLNIRGGGGMAGGGLSPSSPTGPVLGGSGGSSILGGGGNGVFGTVDGVAGGDYGGGGGGTAARTPSPPRNGGAGAGGVVIVEEFY